MDYYPSVDPEYVKKIIKMIDAMRQEKINQSEENDMFDVRRELKKLTKGEDQVLLEEYGIIDENGDVTRTGEQEIVGRLLEKVKADLVADLKKLDAKRKKKKA